MGAKCSGFELRNAAAELKVLTFSLKVGVIWVSQLVAFSGLSQSLASVSRSSASLHSPASICGIVALVDVLLTRRR